MRRPSSGRDALLRALALALAASASAGCLIDRSELAPGRDAATDAPLADEDAARSCAPSQTACGASCVDLTTDAQHCGSCDAACADGERCADSRCECAGVLVHGVCPAGLRAWLDARDPLGDGSPPAPGPLARWANLARTDVGDASPVAGAPVLELGAAGRPVVRLEATLLETSGVLTTETAHLEVMIVARTRDLAAGATLATRLEISGSPLAVELPGREGAVFALPRTGESVLTTPFGRDTRHTTLWHAFSGAEGTELRIDGIRAARTERRGVAEVAGTFLVGGSGDGAYQSVDVSEVLVFDRPLSEADRATLTAALLARWELVAPTMPSDDGLQLWLDARAPLTGESPVDGAPLPRWDDRAMRAGAGTTTGVTWSAAGLGPERPAVVLSPSAGPSHVEIRRPVSDAMTALVVVASEDGSGRGEGWSAPCVLGADGRFTIDDAAIVLRGGRVGFGRDPSSTPVSAARYDDGSPHLVVLRRAADGTVAMWVDHEPVLTVPGSAAIGVTSPASWWLGRHADPAEGALAARYAEVLVYDRALGDEELALAERYLSRRWSTLPSGRLPHEGPCAPGTHLACPALTLAELRSMPAGRYWLDVGRGPMRVSVDDAEGGGWLLVLQYLRGAGQNPELEVIAPGLDWPAISPGPIGVQDPLRSDRWGHLGADAASLLGEATELRWYASTTAHPRIIHFRSSVGVDGWRRGVNELAGLPAMHTVLTGATATVPMSATLFGYLESRDTVLTDFPFFQAGVAEWAVRGVGSRWSVDDFGSLAPATIHRVWVR